MVGGRRRAWMVWLLAMLLVAGACGRGLVEPGAVAAAHSPSATATPLLPCNPAAADYQKAGQPTPGPCISIDPNVQMQDNLKFLQRREPRPADAAALGPAAVDLNKVFTDLRTRGSYDVAAVSVAIGAYPPLAAARAHPPQSEKLMTVDARVVVVLEHGSACLIGEHGPTRSVVYVAGLTLDGGCEAIYGH